MKIKKPVSGAPKDILSHLFLASNYSQAGRGNEARAAIAEVLRITPEFSLEPYKKGMYF